MEHFLSVAEWNLPVKPVYTSQLNQMFTNKKVTFTKTRAVTFHFKALTKTVQNVTA